ncbi:MAG: YbaB/EbfC family nucleoid-associated protein [Chloroflexia bacterium]
MRLDPRLLRQVQQKQEQVMQDLAGRTVEVTVGGGAVRLVMNGQQEVQELAIAPEVIDPKEVEMLQDLLIAAFNEGVARSRQLAEESMRSLLEGLGLPGLRR